MTTDNWPDPDTLRECVPAGNPPSRVCKSELQQCVIEKLNEDARGLARHQGKVTFIEGALPGETVTFCLSGQRANYDTGWATNIDKPSPDRVTPACPHYGVCGGCSLQHLSGEAQIGAKEAILRDKFHQFGRLSPEHWLPPLTGPLWHYRRSARIGARFVDKKNSIMVGFRERSSRYIAPLQSCPIMDKRISDQLPALHYLINQLQCRRRIPQIEIACSDEIACMVIRHLVPLTASDMDAMKQFAAHTGIHICTQAGGPETIQPLSPDVMPDLSFRLPEFNLEMRYGPAHFVQVNSDINQAMIHQAMELLAPGPEDHVTDLFCGLGNFTLPLGRRAGQVYGVENHRGLLTLARQNAAANGLENVSFHAADLYDRTQAKDFWKQSQSRLLLLDPPRTGAREVLEHLERIGSDFRLITG